MAVVLGFIRSRRTLAVSSWAWPKIVACHQIHVQSRRFPYADRLLPEGTGNLRIRKMSTEVIGLSDDDARAVCHEPDKSTEDFIMQQTMYRIKDPKKSLEFYTNVLGMRLLKKLDFPSMKFSLYFMGYEKAEDIPKDETERTRWMFTRKATVELTHNWGTENDAALTYHNGNSQPQGFGHIGIHVPDVYAACERFEKMGVNFVKRPDDGKMRGLAFITDPDGYRIEILSSTGMAKML